MIYIVFLLFTLFILSLAFYHLQYHLMFTPNYFRSTELDDRYELLSITTLDSIELEGVVYKPESYTATMLFFAGRSYDSVGAIEKLSIAYPNVRIITFNYRSYGKNKGKLTEENIFSDSLHISKIVKKNFGEIYIYGYSLGSSIASYVASKESVLGLFLIGPFDSIHALTRMKYGVNLSWILRYKFDNTKFVKKIDSKTYIFASKSDKITYIQNTRTLKKYVKNLVFYKELEDLTHNELLCNEYIIKKITQELE